MSVSAIGHNPAATASSPAVKPQVAPKPAPVPTPKPKTHIVDKTV